MNANREPRIESQESGKKHLTPHGSITTRTNTQTITRIPQTNLTRTIYPDTVDIDNPRVTSSQGTPALR